MHMRASEWRSDGRGFCSTAGARELASPASRNKKSSTVYCGSRPSAALRAVGRSIAAGRLPTSGETAGANRETCEWSYLASLFYYFLKANGVGKEPAFLSRGVSD